MKVLKIFAAFIISCAAYTASAQNIKVFYKNGTNATLNAEEIDSMVFVKVYHAESVELDKSTVSLEAGGTIQLTASVTPDEAENKNVTWSSSDETVATVSNSGLVTAVNKGTATITVTTEDGNYTAECTITVKDITDFISTYCGGGSISSVNGLIQYGSKLNWYFSNKSSVDVTVVSLQLVDGETGTAGNEMSVNVNVAAGKSTGWSTTIGLLGIHTPVTCIYKYSINGTTYTSKATYTGSW